MAEATTETVTITVDGTQIEARPGELVIAAAERAGVYIPRFCYHPRMRPVGMCRMCLVEVKGPRGFALQPACFIPVADGQEVVTTSDKVKKAQDGVLEFLLINHPLDCPVCDKGGECPLQDQTLTFGPGETRFVEEKRHWEKPIALSELVYIDRERCIQCDRCTRFADEIAGDPLIEFVGRGDHIEVNTFPDQPFSSYFSGNTVQICPVGALLARPYRFRARPWDLEQVESTCTQCAVGCRIAVQSSGTELTRYIGIDSDPVNHGWLCDKGRFSYEATNSTERVTTPLVRKGDELVEASWGEALGVVANGLDNARRVHGSSAVAVLGGARLPNEDAYAWARLAKGVLGTDNVDCQLGDGLPAEAVLGLPRATIDETCAASAVVLLAPDIKEELPVLYLRLRAAAVDHGVPLIELSPHGTGLSRYARASLAYRPGEAPALARALVADADATGDVAGVAVAAVNEARAALRDAGENVVVVLGRPSLAESGESIADAAAALAGRPGVRFLPALRRSNVHGALDMGLAPGVLPGRVSLDAGQGWFRDAWGRVPEARGMGASEIVAAAAEGRIQALVLLGADPACDFPDRRLAREAVAGAGFVVAVDTFLTESSRHADVVLPAAAFAERPGTTTNLEGRVTRLGQKIVPPGVAWPDWMIAVELAHRLGDDLGVESLGDIWDELCRLAPSHAGLTRDVLSYREYRDGIVAPPALDAHGAPDPAIATDASAGASTSVPADVDPAATPGLLAVETQGDPSTAIDPADGADAADASDAADADDEGDDEAAPALQAPPLLTFEPGEVTADTPPLDGYALRLVTSRPLYDAGTITQMSPSLAALGRTTVLRANPYDLDRLGLGNGGRVRVRSKHRGGFVVEAVPDMAVPRGSVWVPFNPVGDGAAELIDATQPVNDVRVETV
ncbi:MAG: NADH-quinone oxidoreductase subunit NuoG [Actinobacteria bacterium]|nr:NADH-quinone oxidoreductase subunit NuoG [Actinomycetota bacterium]